MSTSGNNYPFTFRCPPPWVDAEGQSSSDTLCYECAKLDIEQSFIAAHELYESARRGEVERPHATCRKENGLMYLRDHYFVTSFGNRLSQPTNCKLCNFFAQMVPGSTEGHYKLLAFCSSESYLFEPRKKNNRKQFIRRPWEEARYKSTKARELAMSLEHNVFMALVYELPGLPKTAVPLRWFETDLPKTGAIFRVTGPEADVQRLLGPREIGSCVDYGLLRAWLGRCRCHHPGCARPSPKDAMLSGFRVIDCRSEKFPPDIVERPWSERYVALSYVWGAPSGDWPKTICDAIEVTKRLGERYLWIDRACIDQSNSEQKMRLIAKMDAIYAGAEFTIVCAAGDARSGLPGVGTTPRRPQPRVELNGRSAKLKGKSAVKFAPGELGELVGVTEEEYDIERAGESEWLDDFRFGMRDKMEIDFGELLEDGRLKKEYDIPSNHLEWYREMAEDDGYESIEEYLNLQKELARRIGIPLREMVPYLKREIAESQGWDLSPADMNTMPIGRKPYTDQSKPRRTLPKNKTEGLLTLVSSMKEPRLAIKQSQWATRGWTYQEGVLSNRRLVFTEDQVYWECRGMAVCETTELALDNIHEPSDERMADYMLSGIFDDDLHQETKLQYGFQSSKLEEVGDQVLTLDGHIGAFTSRSLTDDGDSLRAFMGIANRYTTEDGLYLLLGLPVWAGAYANNKPGLRHTFALSISSWSHITAAPRESDYDISIAECPRRSQFPSWTWAGWQGAIEFCNEKQTKTHRTDSTSKDVAILTVLPGPGPRWTGKEGEFESAATDPNHSDFFKALTGKEWVDGMYQMWAADMTLINVDKTVSAKLAGWTPVRTIGDPEQTWRLVITTPLVLQHMNLAPSSYRGEWRRLSGRVVSVHLSIPITEGQLVADHRDGHLVTVLVFASMIPFVYNGIARFLILRRADGHEGWERIGRMNMWITEKEMVTLSGSDALVRALPVRPFGEDITIV